MFSCSFPRTHSVMDIAILRALRLLIALIIAYLLSMVLSEIWKEYIS